MSTVQEHTHRWGPWWGPYLSSNPDHHYFRSCVTCKADQWRDDKPPTLRDAVQDLLEAWERLGTEPGMPVDREALPRFFWTRIERLQEAIRGE